MIPQLALMIAALVTQAAVVSPHDRALQILDADTPTALEMLKGLDTAERRAVAHALVAEFRRPGPKGVGFEDRNEKIEQGLAALGADASAEIPALVTSFVQALADDNGDDNPLSDFYGGFDALVAMGAPAVPALTDLLGARNRLVQITAALSLAKLGKVARVARPKVLALAIDVHTGNFEPFLVALQELGLDGLTPSELDAVATAGVKVMNRGIIAALPDRCLPLLARELDNPPEDRGQRIVLLMVVAELEPTDPRIIGQMIRYLDDSDVYVVKTAMEVLAKLGAVAKSAAPVIAAHGLAHRDTLDSAAHAVAKLDPESASVFVAQAMASSQADDCGSVATLAPSLHVDLGPMAEPFSAALADGRCHLYLMPNLTFCGPRGVEALVRLLENPKPAVQVAAMGALGVARGSAAGAVPAIVAAGRRMVATGVPGASRSAHDALFQIGSPEAMQAAQEFPR